ncbi:hypothetical protein [Luteimonas deserti]|uniref:hypothetical protein n=1 Tax=Luteimonas deserti TaxID=2752306 RepID=UPI001F39F31A|nr:hypothetical protein [Luteimonas deserti]
MSTSTKPAAPQKAPLPTAERKSKQAPTLSHDRIAADIAAFRKAGGKVEVLGNTPIQRRVTPASGAAVTPAVAAPAAATRARR